MPPKPETGRDLALQPEDAELLQRIGELPQDVGWLFVYMGVLGVIVPGIPGLPFFLAAAAILTPNGPKHLSRWVGAKPSPIVRGSLKQIVRFVDDLDARYPRLEAGGR